MSTKDAIVPVSSLAALANVEGLAAAVAANLSGGAVSQFDLPRIKIAAGGLPLFVCADGMGNDERTVKGFDALVVARKATKSYWLSEDVGGGPPDCSSPDGRTGFGVRAPAAAPSAHDCLACPHSAFGSARRADGSAGPGKACKDQEQLFLLRLDEPRQVFPSLLILPPSSLGVLRRYLTALTARGVAYWTAVHTLGVEVDESAGNKFGRVKIRFARLLDGAELAKLDDYRKNIVNALTGPA